MSDVDKDDFFVEDEPLEEAREAFRQGEKGRTTGPRDLNKRAKSIVDRAVQRLESAEEGPSSEPVSITWIEGAFVVERLHFGGYGQTTFSVVRGANVREVEVSPL